MLQTTYVDLMEGAAGGSVAVLFCSEWSQEFPEKGSFKVLKRIDPPRCFQGNKSRLT